VGVYILMGDGKMNCRTIKSQKNLFSVAIVLLCFSFTNAGFFSVPLPSLNGRHTGSFDGPGSTAHADFQTEFLSIDEVSIHLIGTYTPGTGHYYTGQPGSVYGELWVFTPGWTVLPRILHPSEFDLSLRFDPLTNPEEDWSMLMDGDVDITLRLLMGTVCDIIDEVPEIDLTFAELLVEGTAIPEPATLALLGLGGFWLRKRRP
jgi:hypothetical protein